MKKKKERENFKMDAFSLGGAKASFGAFRSNCQKPMSVVKHIVEDGSSEPEQDSFESSMDEQEMEGGLSINFVSMYLFQQRRFQRVHRSG